MTGQMPAPISGEEVRRRFVEFFEERGHREVPSSSLVPHNDPTVLLTTAGMQQMTPYFMGLEQPPAHRMVSVQKCFRDRKSTRLNSSHANISYAVFCLKKKSRITLS